MTSSWFAPFRIRCAADESRVSLRPNSNSSPGAPRGEEAVQQHPAVAVGLGRVDQHRLEPRSAEHPALAFDDPDAARHRLLEHLGRDRLGGEAQQHGALERVDHRAAACTPR